MTNDSPIAVLVVDDHEDNATGLADILKDCGYDVDVAFDGSSALQFIARRHYSFALVDYQMPGMNGVKLLTAIRRVQPCLVAMMITAFAGTDGVEEARAMGTWRVLRKPVDLGELLGLLDTAANQPLVLVVDDDEDFSASAIDLLRENGFRVCNASDQDEAITRIHQLPFDAVLLDLALDSKNATDVGGEEVFEAMRQSDSIAKPLPLVYVVTGQASEKSKTIDRMVKHGIDGVFQKPIDLPTLLSRLSDLTKNKDTDHVRGDHDPQ